MTDTPNIDAAIRAGCDDDGALMQQCCWPECKSGAYAYPCNVVPSAVLAALRAALPWEPPAERLEAMAKAWWEAQCTVHNAWKMLHPSKKEMARDYALAAYRADLIMRELYPERFGA